MNRKIDSNERQILKFPGFCPCEWISPTTLLTSLIELSHDIISFRSKFFPIHEELAREVFTQVEILITFFEEIRDNVPILSNSLKLCLSVLQFSLQKGLFLLEDCARYGARLYILMKSQLVVDEFKSVVRSVATALDIVELHTLEKIDSKVKESVELLADQAKKSQIEPDAGDEWAIERIMFILLLFEKGCKPELDSINSVLNHLGIKSWADCNKEVMFLEDEISKSVGDDKEIELLSSLVGLMCYCRGVVFDTLDTIAEQKINRCEEMLCLFPEGFRCPISLKIMVDPVTISTGETYDRASIQKWLKAGNLFCPKTGKEFLNTNKLVSNIALKSVIHQFCINRGITISKTGKKNYDLNKTKISPSPACRGAMRFLAQFFAERLQYGTYVEQNKAAYEIRLLTKSNIYTRSVLIEARNVAALLDLLTSTDANTQENAIAAILKLARHNKALKAIIEGGGLFRVISVLRRGLKMESRRKAAMTIFQLASVEKYRKLIGSTEEAIPGLVELIKDGNVRCKKTAMVAIYGLLLYHDNHEKSLVASIVPVLLDLISSTERSGDIRAHALELLACLAEKINGSIAILQSSGFPLILRLLESPISLYGKEGCVSILLSLSSNSGTDVLAKLDKETEIMPCLYTVYSEGKDQAREKARTLINMLINFREASYKASTVRK